MTRIAVEEITVHGIPDLHRLIITSRGNMLAIGRPCHSVDRSCMAAKRIDMATNRGIPDLHRFIAPRRGDAPAIGRPRHRPHPICMTAIREEGCSYSVGW